ncbi:MAG: hypothetical protein SFV81_07995 [Pirellulaceae bacterium]|nr:hypothetical protein [Pirellulaceae bacterium]
MSLEKILHHYSISMINLSEATYRILQDVQGEDIAMNWKDIPSEIREELQNWVSTLMNGGVLWSNLSPPIAHSKISEIARVLDKLI